MEYRLNFNIIFAQVLKDFLKSITIILYPKVKYNDEITSPFIFS